MAHIPYTRETILAAGYVALGDTQNLFIHTRWPGFLFRLVDTLDQAIACGGVMLRSGDQQIMYFGLDMTGAIKGGKFGRYAQPTEFSLSRNGLSTVTEVHTPGYGARVFRTGSRIDMKSSDWTEAGPDGEYVGVISRADRGLIVDRAWKADIPDKLIHVPFVREGIVNNDGSQGKGWYTHGADGAPQTVALGLASLSGFISNHIPLRKRQFLAAARDNYIASMDADSKIIDAYRRAYDEHLATIAADAVVVDTMTVFPYTTGVDTVVQFGAERRENAIFRVGDVYRDDQGIVAALEANPIWLLVKNDKVEQRQASGGAWEWPPKVELNLTAARGITFVASLPHEQTVGGLPFPFWGFVGASFSLNSRNTLRLAPFDGRSQRLLAPGALFTMDAIPFTGVKLLADSTIPASALFSGFGPRVGPDSMNPEKEKILDIADRVNIEVSAVTGIPPLPVAHPGANDTEREANASAANSALAAREAAILAACKHLTPFTAFITETVTIINSRARRLLKASK